MGMFDYIKCKYKLLNSNHQDLEFQTKDLNCNLTTFIIDEDGYLYEKNRYSKEHLLRDDVLIDITGSINFNDYIDGVDIQYLAKFEKGKLINIHQI